MSEGAVRQRRPQRRSPWPRRMLLVLVVLAVFALGVALGQALDDSPSPPASTTFVRTLEPVPERPSTTNP